MPGVDQAAGNQPAGTKPSPTQRKLLLVSYWYPPALGAAAERMQAFAHYLPQHGWQARVLTARHDAGQALGGADAAVRAVKDPLAHGPTAFPDYDPRDGGSPTKSYLRGLVFPDRFALWQRAALQTGRGLIEVERPDLMLVSFPPASAVLLALRLHQATGLASVLDFRDRWFGPGGYEPRQDRMRRKHVELQQQAIRAAAGIITVSETMAAAVAEEHDYDRRRIAVVPNGYEPAEEAATADVGDGAQPTAAGDQPSASGAPQPAASPNPESAIRNPQSAIVVSHVGTVIARNRPDLFLDAILHLKGHDCLRGVTFRFVGNLSRAYLDAVGLSPIVQTTGMVAREQARAEMQKADALLLLTGGYVGRWGHNAKVFEYIQTGRPIFCLEESPGSNDRRLLERFVPDRAFFAPVGEAAVIAEQLLQLRQCLSRRPTVALELDPAFRDYNRLNLAGQLAAFLDQLTGAAPAT